MSLEVLDLNFDKQTGASTQVNDKFSVTRFMTCLWMLLWIKETKEIVKGLYYFCRKFVYKSLPILYLYCSRKTFFFFKLFNSNLINFNQMNLLIMTIKICIKIC